MTDSPVPPTPFLTNDAAEAYKYFCEQITKFSSTTFEICTADTDLVRVNLNRGIQAVTPYWSEVPSKLPQVKIHELQELPALALALTVAVDRVFKPASPHEIRTRQAEQRPARRQTLGYLELVAELGLIPSDPVKNIRKDRGPIDEAKDGIAIVALFKEQSAALTNKHPFSASFLEKLAKDSNWLLAQLTPDNATPEKREQSPDALIRNQLWTELVRRYDQLYLVGVAIWGRREVDNHIPALQSRVASPATAQEPPRTAQTSPAASKPE